MTIWSEEYTPENLKMLAKRIEELRRNFLCTLDDAGADLESEQYYWLSLAALDQAHHFMSLASIKQSQDIR